MRTDRHTGGGIESWPPLGIRKVGSLGFQPVPRIAISRVMAPRAVRSIVINCPLDKRTSSFQLVFKRPQLTISASSAHNNASQSNRKGRSSPKLIFMIKGLAIDGIYRANA